MKIVVLSSSPKQQLSLTLQTVRALQKMCPMDEFDINFIKDVNDHSAFEAKANDCDLVLILSSLYHFNVHGQLIAFLEGIKIKEGTPITYITTSGHNMDIPAHNYVRSFAKHNHLKWIQSLSLLDEDILKEERREELYRWFMYVKDIATNAIPDEKTLAGTKVKILDAGDEAIFTEGAVKQLKEGYEAMGANVSIINLREKTIKGCIACFGCYTNNTCVIKDDFKEVAEDAYDSDMVITVSNTSYNQFSKLYKYFLDRHVTYGRFGQEHEIVKGYVVCGKIDSGDLAELEQHTLVVDSLDRDTFAGVYVTGADTYNDEAAANVKRAMIETAFACKNELFPQRNTYSYGLALQFANLAYRLQKMTINDYNYYKERGYYESPEIVSQVRPVGGLEDGRMSCKMRLIAFEEMLANLKEGPPKLTHRGERLKIELERAQEKMGNSPKKESKKGFGFFGKK